MAWRILQDPLYPWVHTLDRIIASVRPASMRGPTMVIASDYSGLDKRSRYRVNVHICVDLEASAGWEISRQDVRRRFLGDGRRMSYKRLSDRWRAEALLPFLSAAEEIRGLCVATIFNKALRHLCLNSGDEYDKMRDVAGLQARWKNRELEEALRMTHIIACLIGGLSLPGQNIYWISDEDSLFGNQAKSRDVARLLSSFSSHYAHHRLGELGVGTTSLDEGDRFEEDLTAIPDLVAGGLAETTNRVSELCGGRIPANLAIDYPKEFLMKADLVSQWFWAKSERLRRVAILFEQQPDGRYTVSKHEMVNDWAG